ncbi:hypothetical protein H0S57_05805 [Acinetobacter johnsonii]|uniref:hypothetical protein n=1 Tax=Acinetobacter johnsonii TaxID=40214 RepID=UPI00189C838D|nr:hypothetical protein [Acinetobacter johnsonii]QPF36112.1 hypothetical protein H0S57_05805 [Acinetobacter johnsonii]
MNVISLQNHVQLTETKKQKVDELVAKCITLAVANTGSMRNVLKGDMRTVVLASNMSKAS